MNTRKIGRYILRKRNEMGYTREQLAVKAGVKSSAIEKYEAGEKIPASKDIKGLCAALQVSAWSLLNGEEQPQNDRILIRLLRISEVIRMLWTAIIGLLIMNAAVYIQPVVTRLLSIEKVADDSFLYGFCNGAFTGIKIVGVVVFAYGIASYIRSAAEQKR